MTFPKLQGNRSFPIDHAGAGGCTPGSFGYTLSGQTFLVDSTLYKPTDVFSPDGQAGEVLLQTWGGGASGVATTGAGGGAGYSERTIAISATEPVSVAQNAAAGASGADSGVGVGNALCLAKGGQSPSGGIPGQGGQASAGIGDITTSGGNGSQGGGSRDGGGSGGRTSSGGQPTAGRPNGSYAHLPGALSGWPGGGGGSTGGAGNLGRAGLVRTSYLIPSLPNAPRIVSLTEFGDATATTSRSCVAGTHEAGDLLVLIAAVRNVTTITAPTWADGLLTAQSIAGLGNTIRVLYRTATGTAADDATVVTSASVLGSGHMYAIRGASTPPEWDTSSGTGGAVLPPPHVNSFGYLASLAIAVGGMTSNNGVRITSLIPNFEGTIVTPGASDQGVLLATCWLQFNGASIIPGTFLNDTMNWTSGTITIGGV